jgi:glycyl-tRNA synthetase
MNAATAWSVNKQALDDCIMRRMFYIPAFEIHGGVGGLFDYGPPGCAMKENMLALWRSHFILEDSMLQIECTTLTPYSVLKTSGHVDKFEDLMVKDPKNGECYRADKLLEDFIANLLIKGKVRGGEGERMGRMFGLSYRAPPLYPTRRS